MMPPPEANPLNQFVLASNLYETNKKIECLATCVVIAEGKHNMSIIEGTYDNVKAVVKKVRIMDDSKGTELKKKLRDACFHENLVAFLGCENGKLKDLQDIAHVILYIVSKGVHLLEDVAAVNPGLVDEKDLMKLVGTNAEVIDLLKKIRIVQLQTAQPSNHLTEGNPTTALQTDIKAIIYDVVDSKSVLSNGRPSWHSKFTNLMNSMAKFFNTNKKAGWKYVTGKVQWVTMV
nr:hypothetical protein [Tanacetum cinerariifolium]